jgi:hypothetical protein
MLWAFFEKYSNVCLGFRETRIAKFKLSKLETFLNIIKRCDRFSKNMTTACRDKTIDRLNSGLDVRLVKNLSRNVKDAVVCIKKDNLNKITTFFVAPEYIRWGLVDDELFDGVFIYERCIRTILLLVPFFSKLDAVQENHRSTYRRRQFQ